MNLFLQYCGFDNEFKQQKLQFLMKKALDSETGSFDEIFKSHEDLNKDPVGYACALIGFTQKYFVMRKGNEERSQVITTKWMYEEQNEIIESLKILQMLDEIIPKFTDFYAVCVLGAYRPTINVRFKFAEKLMEMNPQLTQKLFLLSGEREVALGSDGDEDSLKEVLNQCNIVDLSKLNEAHLMEHDLKQYICLSKLQPTLINTPKALNPDGTTYSRPTTATTVEKLFKDYPILKGKKLLFISNAPYIQYQKGIIAEVLRMMDLTIDFEVVGSSISLPHPPSIDEKATLIKRAIGELGAAIYSNTLSAICKMIEDNKLSLSDESIEKPKAIEKLKDIYKSNPLFFQNVDRLFLPLEKQCASQKDTDIEQVDQRLTHPNIEKLVKSKGEALSESCSM